MKKRVISKANSPNIEYLVMRPVVRHEYVGIELFDAYPKYKK